MSGVGVRYCSNLVGELDVCVVDDGVLVFEPASRATRFLPPVAWGFFKQISQAGVAGLEIALLASYGNGELSPSSTQLLEGMELASLVRRC